MLRVGTRGSALALAQARTITERLAGAELIVVESSGAPTDDKARWTRSLDRALLDGEVDLTIHSAKDVPSERPPGIATRAVPRRGDPRDALCGAESPESLDPGARVGTASPRRTALIGAFFDRAETVDLRGNVDTRLRKLDAGECDAAVLAAAGLSRTALGALATLNGPTITLTAICLASDGSSWIRDSIDGPIADPDGLGSRLAERMLAVGAADLLAASKGER